MKERIEFLVKYLNERTAEYDAGKPTISDSEWDTLYFELKDLPKMEIVCERGVYQVRLSFQAERVKKFNVLR